MKIFILSKLIRIFKIPVVMIYLKNGIFKVDVHGVSPETIKLMFKYFSDNFDKSESIFK